jgi:predicted Zn-dependent peptidase
VPAIVETMGVLRAIRESEVEEAELRQATDFLVGVFPLRFETSSQVAAALGGIVVHELPDDELDRYRPQISAVGADAVLEAARRYIRPDDACVVVVGDAARVEQPLRDTGIGRVEVIPADQPSR